MLAHKSRTKSPRNIKIVKLIMDATNNNAQQFQGQRSSSTTAETKSVSYLQKGRLRNLKTGTPIEHALYQLPRPAIKAYEVGFLQTGGGIPCRPHPAAMQLVLL